jgi:hypothetical protein
MGRPTLGHAAEMAGMECIPFLNELGRRRISGVNHSPAGMTQEIAEAAWRVLSQ